MQVLDLNHVVRISAQTVEVAPAAHQQVASLA